MPGHRTRKISAACCCPKRRMSSWIRKTPECKACQILKLRRLFVFLTVALVVPACVSMAASANQDVPLPRSKPVQPQAVKPLVPDVNYSNLDENTPGRSEQCKAALDAAGASYKWVGVATEGACTIGNAVELVSVRTSADTISFRQKPVMACEFAALLAKWTGEVAGPVVAAHAGARLQAITTGPGIVCRNRAGGAKSKISEHAKGNAIDITVFRLSDTRSLQIGGKLDKTEQLALKALRTSACGYFTTVLGPGSNSAHQHHFHFDHAKRGKSYNYRICE